MPLWDAYVAHSLHPKPADISAPIVFACVAGMFARQILPVLVSVGYLSDAECASKLRYMPVHGMRVCV